MAVAAAVRTLGECVLDAMMHISVLHLASDAIPKSVIDGIIANMGDADALRRAILPYLERRDRAGPVPRLASSWKSYGIAFSRHGRPPPTQQILDVQFEFGEQVLASDWKAEAFARLTARAALIPRCGPAEGWGQEHAGAHLLEALRNRRFPSLLRGGFSLIVQRRARQDSRSEPALADCNGERSSATMGLRFLPRSSALLQTVRCPMLHSILVSSGRGPTWARQQTPRHG